MTRSAVHRSAWSTVGMASAALLVCLVGLVVVVGLSVRPGSAQDLVRDQPDAARELAERYAPIVRIKAQENPCDVTGEPYAPTTVDIVLDNPEVLLRQLGSGDPVLTRAPGAADLFGLGEGAFLDFPGSVLDPGCLYETDFRRFVAERRGPGRLRPHRPGGGPPGQDRPPVLAVLVLQRLEQQARERLGGHPVAVRGVLDRRGPRHRAHRGRVRPTRGR